VRYTDDFLLGFESGMDARRMLADVKDRLAKFGLALHEDKTRPIEFGRFAFMSRESRGNRRLETFTSEALLGASGAPKQGMAKPVIRMRLTF
jgi:RNA-directed DNA polymerase